MQALAGDAHVRGEASAGLVAQAQAGLDAGQAGADPAPWIVPAVQLQLERGLQDQAVGEQQLVLHLDPGHGVAALAEVGSGRDLEPVRGKALYPERRPGPGGSRAEVVADAADHVPPGPDAAP